jgi:hypothetical protein
LRLYRGNPMRLIIVDDRHLSGRVRGQVTEPRKVIGCRRHLSAAGRKFVQARQIEPGMHLLLREGRLSPAKKAHNVGAVRVRFERPQPDHSARRRRVPRRPVDGSRLLLHHPEASPTDAPIKVMVKRRDVRVWRS